MSKFITPLERALKEKESYIGSGVLSKYCPECGQKLDWE